MGKEQDNQNDYLLFNCAWCCPPKERKLQPPLPSFAITDGICHEHKLIVYLRNKLLPQYLEKQHTTVEDLLTQYIESGIK